MCLEIQLEQDERQCIQLQQAKAKKVDKEIYDKLKAELVDINAKHEGDLKVKQGVIDELSMQLSRRKEISKTIVSWLQQLKIEFFKSRYAGY